MAVKGGKSPACRGGRLCHSDCSAENCLDSDQSLGSSRWAGMCPGAEDGHEKQFKARGFAKVCLGSCVLTGFRAASLCMPGTPRLPA